MGTTIVKPLADWIRTDDRLVFAPPYKGIRARTQAPRVLVGHWTGGEGGADRVFAALKNRVDENGAPSPLSVQFVIDADGATWQFCDLDRVVCFHAGAVNDWSLGAEIVNRGLPPALSKRARPIVAHNVHGHLVQQLAYTPAQLDAWCRLADLVCARYGIPRQVPGDAAGQVLDRTLTAPERARWSGIAEHLHLAKRKSDGGTQLSRALLAHGYAANPPVGVQKGER